MLGVFCNGQSFCNPDDGTCVSTSNTCNDENECNGIEICNENTCSPAEPTCDEVVVTFPQTPTELFLKGFFFDLSASLRDIQVEKIQLYAKGSGTIKILIRAGTAKGYASSSETWDEIAQLTLSNLASSTYIEIPITDPLKMYAGTSFGMFIYADSEAIASSAGERPFTRRDESTIDLRITHSLPVPGFFDGNRYGGDCNPDGLSITYSFLPIEPSSSPSSSPSSYPSAMPSFEPSISLQPTMSSPPSSSIATITISYTGTTESYSDLVGTYQEALDCVEPELDGLFGYCYRKTDGTNFRIWTAGCEWTISRFDSDRFFIIASTSSGGTDCPEEQATPAFFKGHDDFYDRFRDPILGLSSDFSGIPSGPFAPSESPSAMPSLIPSTRPSFSIATITISYTGTTESYSDLVGTYQEALDCSQEDPPEIDIGTGYCYRKTDGTNFRIWTAASGTSPCSWVISRFDSERFFIIAYTYSGTGCPEEQATPAVFKGHDTFYDRFGDLIEGLSSDFSGIPSGIFTP